MSSFRRPALRGVVSPFSARLASFLRLAAESSMATKMLWAAIPRTRRRAGAASAWWLGSFYVMSSRERDLGRIAQAPVDLAGDVALQQPLDLLSAAMK